MPVKDYYKILELPPNAGQEEVKKNFRKLAIRFHPDKTGGNRQKDAWYHEIQEAYTVLSDPAKKAQYLQERWLLKSKGLPFYEAIPLTPEFIEQRFRAKRVEVSHMDHFRMDDQRLQKELLLLASDEILDALAENPDPPANFQIIEHLFYCMEPLEYQYIITLKPVLLKIARHQPDLQKKIEYWYQKRKRQHWWDRKQGWIIGGITLLLCLLIALLTGR
jgi:DnaJ domain